MLSDALKKVADSMVSVEATKAALTEAEAAAKIAAGNVDRAKQAWLNSAEGARAAQAELQKTLADLMPPEKHVIR